MPSKRRQPQSLHFKGWWVDGPEIRVQTRLAVSVGGGREQEVGPNLTLIIPADCLLAEDICEAAATAQHRQETREKFQQAVDGAYADRPLF